jgi:hypothetical protein
MTVAVDMFATFIAHREASFLRKLHRRFGVPA